MAKHGKWHCFSFYVANVILFALWLLSIFSLCYNIKSCGTEISKSNYLLKQQTFSKKCLFSWIECRYFGWRWNWFPSKKCSKKSLTQQKITDQLINVWELVGKLEEIRNGFSVSMSGMWVNPNFRITSTLFDIFVVWRRSRWRDF